MIDTAFFDEDKNDDGNFLPQLYYMAVLPSGSGTGSDTTPPSVAAHESCGRGDGRGHSPARGERGGRCERGRRAVRSRRHPVGHCGHEGALRAQLGHQHGGAGRARADRNRHVIRGNTPVSAPVGVTVQNAGPSSSGRPRRAAYAFDEGVGTTVAYASGHGHGGTIEGGAKWTNEGKFGSALAFDGAQSWVTVADAPDLDLSDAMTLEAWVRPRTLGAAGARCSSRSAPAGSSTASMPISPPGCRSARSTSAVSRTRTGLLQST